MAALVPSLIMAKAFSALYETLNGLYKYFEAAWLLFCGLFFLRAFYMGKPRASAVYRPSILISLGAIMAEPYSCRRCVPMHN